MNLPPTESFLGMKRVNAKLVPKDLNVPSHYRMIVTDFFVNS